jgi:hypothetical protein
MRVSVKDWTKCWTIASPPSNSFKRRQDSLNPPMANCKTCSCRLRRITNSCWMSWKIVSKWLRPQIRR